VKKHFINTLVAVGLLATLSSCSKEDQANLKPETKSVVDPRDPGEFGYYQIEPGEVYYYKDSISSFSQATKHYLTMKPLSLEKYKNGALLDSVCNKDLAFYFESKGKKTQDNSTVWGVKPLVTDEHAPIVTVNSADHVFSIKTSKMVTAMGFEINPAYKGTELGVNISFWNSKLNQEVPKGGGTIYLNYHIISPDVTIGLPGGAIINGIEATKPFNEIRITFEPLTYGYPDPIGPFEISFSGFRYILTK
jgi:hypothetical protein